MEESAIPNILKSLQASRNKQSVYQNLLNLRRVVTNKNQFTIVLQRGGISVVIGCLLKKNVNIIDTALSILGNCCTEHDCAKEVVRYHGLKILSDILKNWSQDSVICRTCRLIGNIAQYDNYASEFYKYGIVSMIVAILNKSTSKDDACKAEGKEAKDGTTNISMGTQAMAVRVLRLLWESYSNRFRMIQDGAVRAVSLVLIRHTEKWSDEETSESLRKQTEKLLENVLKCLLLFSKWGTIDCAQQMLADGNGFKTLVALIEINPYTSVKCLTNLSHVATSRSDIANAAAVESIVAKLKMHLNETPNERCSNDLISAFCLFCKHPMNCSEVKRAGGLQLILKILQNCRSRRQEYQIAYALSNFHIDDQSHNILLTNGVVSIVTDCLERNLKCKGGLDEDHRFIKRRKRPNVKLQLKISQHKKRVREKGANSPESPLSESSPSPKTLCLTDPGSVWVHSGRMTPPDSDSSPFSSPSCTPPRKFDDVEEDDDDSVNYSPVCSDNEQEELDSALDKNGESTVLQTPEPEVGPDEEEYVDNEKSHFECSDLQERAIIMMLMILCKISYKKPGNPDMSLATKHTITVLLKYLRESRHPEGRITTLLSRIMCSPDNLLQLIKSESVQIIQKLTDIQHSLDCSTCFRMNRAGQLLLKHIISTAESPCGRELLYNFVPNGTNEERKNYVVVIPVIVRLKSMLAKFMNTWSCLDLLLNLFVEQPNLRYQVTVAFNKLACSININNPVLSTVLSTSTPEEKCNLSDSYTFDSTGKNVITIQLDDGSTVETDRDFLIDQADYFKIMLTGSFKESSQEIICLKNVSSNALQCLLNLLHGGYSKNGPCKLDMNLPTILEVIVLTDIYLMEDLTDWLTRCVEQYLLKKETASVIYNWSVVSGTNFLRVETVAFILTAEMKDTERFLLFQSIIDCGFVHEIKDDVQKLITRYLKIR